MRFTDTYIEPAMAAEKQALTALGPDDSDTLPRSSTATPALLNQAVDDRCASLPPAERHA